MLWYSKKETLLLNTRRSRTLDNIGNTDTGL